MLLRRITKHVKEQNWFAVGIDFFIVVVGVFIGIQVANWNSDQSDKRQAAAYTERLYDDVVNLIATRQALIEDRAKGFADLADASDIIINGTADVLSDEQCTRLAYVQAVSNPTDELGTLIELQSSGQLSILKDQALRAALQNYLLARARSRDSQAQISRVVEPLLRLHPDLIEVTTPTNARAGEVSTGSFKCDLEAMRRSVAFKNDLEIAQSHLGFHVADNMRITKSLEALKLTLETALRIPPDGETAP